MKLQKLLKKNKARTKPLLFSIDIHYDIFLLSGGSQSRFHLILCSISIDYLCDNPYIL